MKFGDVRENPHIYLYCGNMNPNRRTFTGIPFVGLSLWQEDNLHIKFDITHRFDLHDDSVDVVQSEDVFEHIEIDKISGVLNEIHRVLKPGGYLRMSVPDYACDVLYDRSVKDETGTVVFDAGGGGRYDPIQGKVTDGGHVWFPTYGIVKRELDKSPFGEVVFYHYYDEDKNPIMEDIDYSRGYVSRTPDHDQRVMSPRRPMSIVVDCFK